MTLFSRALPGLVLSVSMSLTLSMLAGTVQADPLETLREFTRDAKTGRANFSQTVSAPDGLKKKSSSGSFEFARPDRFRSLHDYSVVRQNRTIGRHR